MHTPDVQKTDAAAQYVDTIGKYIAIYLCILVLAALQFYIAYQHIDGSQKFARMFFVAFAEAGLAVMFFMHLWAEKRGFLLFVAIFTIFVTLAMQYSWPDSYRMELGAPNSQPKAGAVQ
ncbi:MAG TPA: cytochrome C oxidase subunit IV family protein [Terriglobales bacterium]|nr:cytochrome C oxidase subunit IV family protein [Terriglobales bacterium]